jgi:hypothetical protein
MLNRNLSCFESRRVSADIKAQIVFWRDTGIETYMNHLGKTNAGHQVQIFALSKSRIHCAKENY